MSCGFFELLLTKSKTYGSAPARSWCSQWITLYLTHAQKLEQRKQVGSRKLYYAVEYTYNYSLIVLCRFKSVYVCVCVCLCEPSKLFQYTMFFVKSDALHVVLFILSLSITCCCGQAQRRRGWWKAKKDEVVMKRRVWRREDYHPSALNATAWWLIQGYTYMNTYTPCL